MNETSRARPLGKSHRRWRRRFIQPDGPTGTTGRGDRPRTASASEASSGCEQFRQIISSAIGAVLQAIAQFTDVNLNDNDC